MRLIPLQRITLFFNRLKYSVQDGGFTLLEILVVLFLIVLIASLIGPKLVLKKNPGLKDIARKIVTESRLLYWEAVSSQKMIRLYYNLEKGTVTAVQIEPNGQKKTLEITGVRPWKMPPRCHFDRIITLHQGKVDSGKTFTQFFPTGAVEPTTIHLSSLHDRSMTLVFSPLNGKVHVYKGDVHKQHIPPLVPGIPGGGASPFIGGG
ncbi:prepilin-type N-terminal cleavage/methylation domain-containing protein [Leptospirillum ferriphilum]|jgi:prepilin-type N-terminal cleavage/methylation domain-containing protein|uniref:General secretion pathway protein H n=1 Tax=Leptospirillum sp. Group II '5-way CG' TaxID=419541 RepID=B6AQ23_9BACT|nr:prepilin-type N-terminal cleavage/methylation domain-containing protein [Leptospirillum ferriphilum]EDZ39359.1 MAG: Hypothetical protein CGL2_11233058 [Leptospirillum sp. Group II '5-way CG']